jgi:hypothetical protein
MSTRTINIEHKKASHSAPPGEEEQEPVIARFGSEGEEFFRTATSEYPIEQNGERVGVREGRKVRLIGYTIGSKPGLLVTRSAKSPHFAQIRRLSATPAKAYKYLEELGETNEDTERQVENARRAGASEKVNLSLKISQGK